MRIINGVIFVALGVCIVVVCFRRNAGGEGNKWLSFMKKHMYLTAILFAANTISFFMTFSKADAEIYIEKGRYGEEEQLIPFVLRKGEETVGISLEVSAQKLSEEELKQRIAEAFSYIEENIKGENESLSEIRTSLDYSLDWERFPFDVEFVSDHYALLDGEGNLKNEKEDLLNLGYTEEEISKGIPIDVEVTLWYEEEEYKQTFSLVVFPKQKSALEEQFNRIENVLKETEQNASYEEGFSVPAVIEDVEVTRSDVGTITPVQVLIAGFVLAGLLIMREQESKKREEKNREEMLIRSYPWFVNEMVLLLGAGMQVRNIFGLLIQESQGKQQVTDYRKPLIAELEIAVRAMELGMSEEQVYYQLGRRLKLPCYIKLMTLLEQNVKRGAKGFTAIFEQEELNALEERKNLAKRYGEEAGTKLLGPMILLLLVIMLMIMIPAFMGIM